MTVAHQSSCPTSVEQRTREASVACAPALPRLSARRPPTLPCARYIDRRVDGDGYDGPLDGWMAHVGEAGSAEVDPLLDVGTDLGLQDASPRK